MTKQQECLRDKLKQGGDIFKHVEALRTYIKENEKIQEGIHDPRIKELIIQQNSELESEYKRLIDVRLKIDACINTIGDTELKSLMTMRYLGHKNTFDIAESMHYGRSTINRKHKAALNIIIESGAYKLLDY